MNLFDSVVRGPQWVPTKLTQIHVSVSFQTKEKKVILCYSFKALSAKCKSHE